MTPAMLGGFELMHDLQRVYRATVYAADAWEYDKLPLRPFSDVGRFAVVFDGYSTGNIVAMAVNPALDGDRLFGLERDTSGTSFLAPAEDTLSATTPLFSPLFSMHADRRAPSPIAAQWDDEGVPIQPYSLIDSGRVVGYHTTRATAPYLSAWAAQHGQPVQSRGSCAVQHAEDLPAGGFSHTFVSHSTARASVRDLMREVKHGFYVLRGGTDVSPGLAGGRFHSAHLMLEIRNGIPVARTTFRAHLEHKTLFGKQLVSLGDASTVRMRWEGVQKGMPWRNIDSMVNAPAMLCKDVEIVGELATP
jgi:predicted Zn-dependent protease